MGNSLAPMAISIAGSCGIRAIWAFVFFPMPVLNTLNGLYTCYPISWAFCVVGMAIALIYTWVKTKKRFAVAGATLLEQAQAEQGEASVEQEVAATVADTDGETQATVSDADGETHLQE